MGNKVYLAVDLGAGSGRVMAGLFNGSKIELEEISRWASAPVKIGNSYHWDINAIFAEVVSGIKKARLKYGSSIASIGIDTWGVDYGLLDSADNLLELPYIYRDARTNSMMEAVFEKVSKDEIYATTGIQFMFFNTLFQMMSEVKNKKNLSRAKTFLMMPDLIAFMLTGVKKNERTNASTTQFYNPFKREWAFDILDKIGAPSDIFKSGFSECGDVIGRIRPQLRSELGDIVVVATGSHDTASAVAATPSQEKNPAYINSGTWSLPGVELSSPVATADAFKQNFTNEVGVWNTIRFLKNVTGMWLVQKSKEAWKKQGIDMDYRALEAAAAESEPMRTLIDTDALEFAMPEDMTVAIADYCLARGKKVPSTHGQIFRAIQESIALKYAHVFEVIERLSGVKIDSINIMGGGSKDAFLNQFTANATGRRIFAGPVESTALGNVLAQMKASGDIANIADGRKIVSSSCQPKVYQPQEMQSQKWLSALDDFKQSTLSIK